jgi:Peptidase A4 family
MRRMLSVGCFLVFVLAGNGPGPAAAESVMHKPRIPVEAPRGTTHSGWASSNWSGYALSGSGYTSVSGSWTVQAVTAGHGSSYSSQWIGIDGFNNSNLIQTGTESDFVNGAARYDAWWEILPAAETVIPSMTVHPGDHMTASVVKGSGSSWTITIKDDTTGASFSTVKTYTGPQTSAEWIEEAPTVGGHVATLANYGLTTFDPGTINGSASPNLSATDSGIMVQRNRQVSTPSNPDRDADGFNMEYGSTVPAPPQS